MSEKVSVKIVNPIGSIRMVGAEGPVKSETQKKIESLKVELEAAHVNIESLKQEKEQIVHLCRGLEQAGSEIEAMRGELIASFEQQIPRLARMIAERIVMQEIEAGRYSMENILGQAIREAGGGRCRVYLNPEDLETVRHTMETKGGGKFENVELEADTTLSRSQCRVETHKGFLEHSISEQLDLIEKAMRGEEG